MPVWPQSTVEIEQRQWHWLNVFLTRGDLAYSGATVAQVAYTYRYEGPNDFNTRILDSVTFNVATGYDYVGGAGGDLTMRVTVSPGSLPPSNGRVTADNGVDPAEPFNYVFYNESTGVITLSAPLSADYSAGATTLTRIDWFEPNAPNGDGYYSVLITPEEVESLGTFTFRIDPSLHSAQTFGQNVEVIPYTGVSNTPVSGVPDICTLYGWVLNLQGTPVPNTSVYARLLATPVWAYGSSFFDNVISAKTDTNGFFQLTIAQNLTIEVIAPDVGYKRVIVVPSTTQANVFELA